MTPAFTHLALHVNDLDACVSFYTSYAGMRLTHDRVADGKRIVWLAEPGKEKDGTMAEHSLQHLSDERRVLARKMIDLIADDETFRGLILDDPIAAMEHAGLTGDHDALVDEFYEVKVDEDEVSGFSKFSLGVQRLIPGGDMFIPGGDQFQKPQFNYDASPTWVVAPSCSFPTTGNAGCGG